MNFSEDEYILILAALNELKIKTWMLSSYNESESKIHLDKRIKEIKVLEEKIKNEFNKKEI